jgi:GAF domain-containing protein
MPKIVRRDLVTSISIGAFVFANLCLSVWTGIKTNNWQAIVSPVLMLVWMFVFFLGGRRVPDSRQDIEKIAYLGLVLCVFGSLSVSYSGLFNKLLLLGALIIAIYKIIANINLIYSALAFIPFVGYVVVLSNLNIFEHVYPPELAANITIIDLLMMLVVLPMVFRLIRAGQSKSLLFRVLFVVFLFNILPSLIITIFSTNILLGSQPTDQMVLSNWLGTNLMVILFFNVIGILLIGRILQPLMQFSKIVARISEEKHQKRIDFVGEDEIWEIAQGINALCDQIRNLKTSLELRVTERTYELERMNEFVQKIAEVGRDITAIRDIEELLNNSVILIGEHFSYDHVLLYLIDERQEFVILVSAYGYEIEDLLARDIRIRVASSDPVGDVVGNGHPRLLKDGELHAFHPLIPQTRSRMVVPLKIGTRTMGALDLHSDRAQEFNVDTLNIQRIVADQLAIAIDNARKFHEMNQSLRELELLTGRYTKESWDAAQKVMSLKDGYVYRGSIVRRRDTQPIGGNDRRMNSNRESVRLPLKLRDQSIGSIVFTFDEADPDPDVVTTLKEMTQRLTLIMENARLVMEARSLAAREQQINQITAQVRGSLSVESILRNTVQELGKAFGASKTFIQIGLTQQLSENDTVFPKNGGGT